MLKGVDALLKGLLCCLSKEGLIDRVNGAFNVLSQRKRVRIVVLIRTNLGSFGKLRYSLLYD